MPALVMLPVAVVDMPDTVVLVALGGGLAGALGLLIVMARYPDPCAAAARRAGGLFGERMAAGFGARMALFTHGLAALRSWRAIAAALTLAAGYWLCILVAIQTWLWSLDIELVWYAPAVVQIVLAFGALIPSAPSSVGTFHFFAKFALTMMGVEAALAGSFAVVGHLMAHIAPAILGLILLSGQLRSEFRRARSLDAAP